MVAIPVALSTSKTNEALLQQWKTIYLSGHKQGPIIATTAGLVHGAVAYAKWSRGEDPTFNILAACFTAGIAPYTWTVMVPTNNSLFRAANEGVGVEYSRTLVSRWRWMNGLRGALPMVGGVMSLVAMLQ